MNQMKFNDESNEKLSKLIDLWFEWDQCQETRNEIEDLKNRCEWKQLEKLLFDRIQFGTAGLRAKMGSGFSQMNELTVIQASQGLLRYIEKCFSKDNSQLSIVIGFDARHQSHRFARLTASLFAHENFRVYLFDSQFVPTPFIPFTVQKLNCHAGIMITASHNPKDDNGYKVYWKNGAQIVSPLDIEIAQTINENLQPWHGKAWNTTILEEKQLIDVFDPFDQIIDLYMKDLSKLSYFPELNKTSKIQFVYTPVHGVGQQYVVRAFEQFQFSNLISVDEQKTPDPNFPTVKYPNPEEGKETLECAIKIANENQADFILANDPDADRFALAERDSTDFDKKQWKILSGNQLGILLGWWRWFTWRNRNPNEKSDEIYMLYSTVSSHFLKSMSKIEGFQTIETLTGFKWLGNESKKLLDQNKNVLFAFEEAIGFMCDPIHVLDKDGITALVIGAEMCNYLKLIGRSLVDQLDYLSTIYGFHLNNNSYIICQKPTLITEIFNRLRFYQQEKINQEISNENRNLSEKTEKSIKYVYPKSCQQYRIIRIRDLTVGIEIFLDDNNQERIVQPSLPSSSSTQMITFYFDNGSEITLRTSGTEPKIKWYSEIQRSFDQQQIKLKITNNQDYQQFRNQIKLELDQMVQFVIQSFLQPERNGLIQRETHS